MVYPSGFRLRALSAMDYNYHLDYLILIDLINIGSEESELSNCPYLEVLRLWSAETVAEDRLDSPRSY